MLKKVLASVGIGGAKVDTQIESDELVAGEPIRGRVVVQGGSTKQQVDSIQLFVKTEVVREKDDRKFRQKVVLDSFSLGNSFTIETGEEKEIDFEITLPLHTPPTIGKTKVWIQTGMDVPNAIDPNDQDFVTVHPHPHMATVLSALTNELGFRLREVEMEYSRKYQYVQEFEFLPGDEFRRDLDELEIIFFIDPQRVEMIVQVDRRAKGIGGLFAEALDIDESFVRVEITRDEISKGSSYVANKLRNIITHYS